ncbi:20393_t:CDS:2, partial [Racocetra persica]
VIALIHTSYLISCSQESNTLSDIINDNELWSRLELFYELLKPYDYVIKILETEKATLGQVAASWAWLRRVINKSLFTNNDFQNSLIIEIDNRWQKIFNPVYLITWFLHPYHHGEGLNPAWLLYIQEAAYGLFCTFYPDYNQDKFIDEWLYYSNHEVLQDFPLRYWHTMLNVAPNLSEFACHLLLIPPNSATSERVWSLLDNIHTERRNRLSPIRAAKMAQVSWYINLISKQNEKKSQKLNEIESNILDNDDYIDSSDDYIDGNDDVDEFI